jgi:hypothetical protein
MRLTTDNQDYSAAGVRRVENMLKLAADFDPGIEPADDFVRAGLSAGRVRRSKSVRPVVLGISSLASGVAAAALLLFVFSHNEAGKQMLGLGEGEPIVSVPGGGDNKAADAVKPPAVETHKSEGGKSVVAQNPPNKRVIGAEESEHPVTRHYPHIETASEETHPEDRSEPVKHIPKVRWRDEVVQRYDRGQYAPAYMVEERDRNGEVVYQPVMMPVTTETGARPNLLNGSADTTIQWTSQSEESSHK